ncbi:MAG: CHAP domain-containing protein [Bulleidia sp.]|nr:CHAP domain-containing protein [Bulleidia sp.]
MKKVFLKAAAVFMALFLTISFATSYDSDVNAEGGNPYYGGWQNCTWSAWQLVYESTGISLPRWGDAGEWAYNAASMGYTVSGIPAPNTIAVWSGHVGYVTAVSEDGQAVYIKEGNWGGTYNEGWCPAYGSRTGQTLIGYIYLGGEAPAVYYTPDQLGISQSISEAAERAQAAQAVAEQQKMIKEEESTIIRVDDAASADTQKSVEKSAVKEIQQEDANQTVTVIGK